MSNNCYKVPNVCKRIEFVVKKSRFITDVFNVGSKKNVHEEIRRIKQEFPDARHHCWAYQLGSPIMPMSAGFSDDGEPNGTAGKPIFNVIQHKNLGDVLVVVTRYFGGIKLGAGGLIRAYSAATTRALDELECIEKQVWIQCSIVADYAFEQSLRHKLTQIDGHLIDILYQSDVEYIVRIPQEVEGVFRLFVASFKFELLLNVEGVLGNAE